MVKVELLGCIIAALVVLPASAGVPGVDCDTNPGWPGCDTRAATERERGHNKGGRIEEHVELFDEGDEYDVTTTGDDHFHNPFFDRELPDETTLEQFTEGSELYRTLKGTGPGSDRMTAGVARQIPAERFSTHSVVHAPAAGFVSAPRWCDDGPDVPEAWFPEFGAAFKSPRGHGGVQCFELDPGDTLYIPAQYWHWVHSDGFGMAVNMWTEEPHRRTAIPRLYKAEASDWPSITSWDPERLMALWTSGLELGDAGGRQGVDHAITCNPDGNHVLPEMIFRHGKGDPSDKLVQMDPAAFLKFADRVETGEIASNLSCILVSEIPVDSPLLKSQLFRFSMTTDAKSHAHPEITFIGAGPELTRTIGDVPDRARLNFWMTLGEVQSGLHYDEEYNSLTLLHGRKRVLLFPRNMTAMMYPVVPWDGVEPDFQSRKDEIVDEFDHVFQHQLVTQPTKAAAALRTVTILLDDFRDDPIVLLMSAELILKHGEWPFARELFDLVIASGHVVTDDVPELLKRANAGLARLNRAEL